MRIFLDANMLFSAAKSAGAIRSFIDLLLKDGHALVADPYVKEEAERNIRSKYPEKAQDLASVLQKITIQLVASHPAALNPGIILAEKDRPVLAAAIKADCGLLVTGDATHFGALYGKTVRGVMILSPRQAAEHLGV